MDLNIRSFFLGVVREFKLSSFQTTFPLSCFSLSPHLPFLTIFSPVKCQTLHKSNSNSVTLFHFHIISFHSFSLWRHIWPILDIFQILFTRWSQSGAFFAFLHKTKLQQCDGEKNARGESGKEKRRKKGLLSLRNKTCFRQKKMMNKNCDIFVTIFKEKKKEKVANNWTENKKILKREYWSKCYNITKAFHIKKSQKRKQNKGREEEKLERNENMTWKVWEISIEKI